MSERGSWKVNAETGELESYTPPVVEPDEESAPKEQAMKDGYL